MTSIEKNADSKSLILFSTSEAIWGGSQIFNESLCHYLNTKEFRAILATSSPDLYSCETLEIESITSRKSRVGVALQLVRRMRTTGTRAVILDDLSGVWLAPLFRLCGIKVISILHLQLKRRDRFGFGHNWATFHLIRFSSIFVHHAFTIGKENVQVFPSFVEFIGNSVAEVFFQKAVKKRKKFDLGAVSRLSAEKNLTLLIRLVNNLNKLSVRPINCVIVGDGPERDRLVALTNQLGLGNVITFSPWVPRKDICDVFDQIKCFAITSHHEGFATTLLESHARGIPAVVSNTSGFGPEFVTLYGQRTGMVFDQKDVEDPIFLKSLLSMVDSTEIYRSECISKASQFSGEIVFGRISRRIAELLD